MSSLPPNNSCLGSQEKILPKKPKPLKYSFLYLRFCCPAWCYTSQNIPLVSLGQLSQPCSLPASHLLWAHSQQEQSREHRHKASILCKRCSATAKTPMCCQHSFSHKSKQLYGLRWRTLTPSQPDPEHFTTCLLNRCNDSAKKAWRTQEQNFHTAPSCLEKANPLPCYFMMYLICSTSGFTTPLSYPNF